MACYFGVCICIGERETAVRSSSRVKKPTQKARSAGLSLQRAGVSVSSDDRGSTRGSKDCTGNICCQ